MSGVRRGTIALWYFGYSAFWGFVVLRSFQLNTERASDFVLALIAGPSIGLSRGHGAEFWVFGSLFLIPLLWAIVEARSLVLRCWCAFAFAVIWGGLGMFMA